jgi:hypothetical protein
MDGLKCFTCRYLGHTFVLYICHLNIAPVYESRWSMFSSVSCYHFPEASFYNPVHYMSPFPLVLQR